MEHCGAHDPVLQMDSGCHRITERLKGPLEVILSSPGPPTTCCPGPCPDSFLVSPRMKTSQPLWAICASAWSPSQWKCISWWSDGSSCVSVCAHGLLSCHWGSLKGAWLHPLCILLSAVYTYWQDFPEAFSRLNSPSSQFCLIWEVLQSLRHLCVPSQDSLKYSHVSLVLGSL